MKNLILFSSFFLVFLMAKQTFVFSAEMETSSDETLYLDAINNPLRWDEDRDRDISSKPIEVLEIMNLKPGMTVLDFQAGTGYFSELLSFVVGVTGKVFAHNHTADGVLGSEVFERRYGNKGFRLANTEQIFSHHNKLNILSASLDIVLMSMTYHDTYWFSKTVDWGPVDHQAFLLSLYEALKSEGIIVLIDHIAAKGSDPYLSAVATHRIDPAVVDRDFLQAGFILQEESNLYQNKDDDYSLSVFNELVYRKTDRFIKVFKK